MKQALMLLVIIFLGFGCSNADDLEDSIVRGHENNLTKSDSVDSFKPNNSVRIDEAAKFFIEYVNVNGISQDISYNPDANCNFYDINKSYSNLKEYVKNACKYGLIRGSNNRVMPNNKLTNAQTVVIMMRIIDGYQEENGVQWATNYYKRAKEIGLDTSKFYNKSAITTRGNMMVLLHNAYMLEDRSDTIEPEHEGNNVIDNYPNCDKDDITIGNYTIAACNVGTNKAGTSPYNTASYGKYYQRGRNTTKETNTIFTKEGRNYKIQGPCADGYHVPTKAERDGIYQVGIQKGYWSEKDGESFAYRLNLPFAGYKTMGNDTIIGGGDRKNNQGIGEYRTSNLFIEIMANAYIADFGISHNNLDSSGNGAGVGKNINDKLPLRCFKDN